VVEIASRNQRVRALLLKPGRPVASVILLAGGDGKLSLGKDGKFGAGNQLVRTRADYAKAGFATLPPFIAPDPKGGSGGVPSTVGRMPMRATSEPTSATCAPWCRRSTWSHLSRGAVGRQGRRDAGHGQRATRHRRQTSGMLVHPCR
jgi:hypothetical protein